MYGENVQNWRSGNTLNIGKDAVALVPVVKKNRKTM